MIHATRNMIITAAMFAEEMLSVLAGKSIRDAEVK
jgi:hypothetical protein